jgi:signal transduction histidine kinase
VIAVLALVAWTISRAGSTEQIARSGRTALAAQAVLGTNDLAVKALGQVVLLSEDNALGVASDEVLSAAIEEGHRVVDDLLEAGRSLGDATIVAALDRANEASLAVIGLADDGRVGDASTAFVETALPTFERVRDLAAVTRGEAAQELVSATSRSATAGRIASFLAAFLIPAGAILIYRSAARRQLRVAEVRLEERLTAERQVVRAKDDFIASISHELRTPLTTIYGFSEILLEEDMLSIGADRDLVELINQESGELARMVEDLLVSARAAEAAMVYNIGRVESLEEIHFVVDPLMRLGAPIHVDAQAADISADRLRFRQIIRNLTVNAVKHGGPEIRITTRTDGTSFECVIADNGRGVPERLRPRLFTRFIHEGEDPLTIGSVGLGLSVVKVLVNDMGGEVRYERRNDWSDFTVTLPLWRPAPRGGASESTTAASELPVAS